MRTFRRRLGSTLMFVGVLLIAYAAAVVFWRDPVTDLYAIYSQRNLGSKLQTEEQQYVALAQQEQVVGRRVDRDAGGAGRAAGESGRAGVGEGRGDRLPARRSASRSSTTRSSARRSAASHIPGMGLSTIVVEGTDRWSSLAKGPGRYGNTSFPGSGSTVGIAGHRTTFSAPFRHIDDLSKGDKITLKMPYGTFVYRVRAHKIVKNNDWSIIKQVGHEQLVLSACHPLYSASHRYVVFADLVTITLPGSSQATPV